MTPQDKRDLKRKVNNALKLKLDISDIIMYINALRNTNSEVTTNKIVDSPHILIDFIRTTDIEPLPKYTIGETVIGYNNNNGVITIIKGTVSRFNTVKLVIRYVNSNGEQFMNFAYSHVYRDTHVLFLELSKLINS